MVQSSEPIQEAFQQQMPSSSEEWAQTPKTVQGFVLFLLARIQAMEAELADLREQVNANSRNSSRPPSGDGPSVPPRTSKRAKRVFWKSYTHTAGQRASRLSIRRIIAA
jgi:hypothetical protein